MSKAPLLKTSSMPIIDINKSSNGNEDVANQLTKAITDLTRKDVEIANLRADLSKALESRNLQRSSSELQLQELHSKTSQQEALLKTLREEHETFGTMKQELEERIETLASEKMAAMREVRKFKSDLEIAKNNMEAMERDLEKSQKLVEQERRRAQYDSSKSVYEAKMAMVTETENRLREDLRAAEQAVTEQARKYELEVSTLKTEVISAKQAEATAISEKSTLEEQRLTFQSEIRRLNTLISTLRSELLESTNMKDELEYRIESTSTEYITIKNQFAEIQEELNSCQDKCSSLQNQLVTKDNDFENMKSQYESAITSHERNSSSYSEIETKLKSENKQLEDIHTELLQRIQTLESINTSLKNEIETNNSEYLMKYESLTTAYESNTHNLTLELQSLQSSLTSEINKSTKLTDELEQCRSTINKLNNNLQESEQNYRNNISKLESTIQEMSIKINNYENELSTIKHQMLQIQASDSELVIEYKSKLSQISQNFEELQRSHTNVEGNLKIEKMHLEELKRTHDSQTEIMRNDRLRLEQEISALHSKLQLQQDKSSSLELERDHLQFTLDSTKTNIETIQSESGRKYETLFNEHNECLRQFELDKSEWKSTTSKLSLQLTTLSDAESRLKLDVKRLELLNNDLTRKCEEESSRLSRLQVAYDDLQISRNSAIEASRDNEIDQKRQHFAETERLKTQLENYRHQINELNRKKSDVESRLEQSKSEYHTYLKSSKVEIESLKKKIQLLEIELSVPPVGFAERVTTELVFQTEIKRLELTIDQLEQEVKSLSNNRHEMNFNSQSTDVQINDMDTTTTTTTTSTTLLSINTSNTNTAIFPKQEEYIRNIELSNQQLLQSEQIITTLQQDLLTAKKTIQTLSEQKNQLQENYEERISSLKSEVQNFQLDGEDFPKNLYTAKTNTTITTSSGTNNHNGPQEYSPENIDMEKINLRLEREIKRLKTLLLFYQQDLQIMASGRSEECSRMLSLESENAAIRSDLCMLRGQLELSNNRAEVLKDFNSKIDDENTRSKKIIKTLRNQLVTSLQEGNVMADNKKNLAAFITTTSISSNTYKSSSANGLYKSTSFPDLLNRQFDESAVAHRKQPKHILSQNSGEFPFGDTNDELISRIESLLAEKAFDRAELYAMEGQLAAIKAADRSLRAELERSRDRYTCQENAMIVYEEQIQDLEDELLLKSSTQKSDFTNNSADFSVFSNQIIREDQIKELENEVKLLEQALVVMKKENQFEKESKNKLQSDLKLLQELNVSRLIDNNLNTTANSPTINEKNYQLKVSQIEIESQNHIINQYKDTIDHLTNEINKNTETIKELNTKLTNNQKQFENLSADHNLLLSKKNKTTDTIKKLNNEISDFTNKVTKLTEQNNKLTSELRTLKEANIRLQESYSKSQSTQSQLQLQLANTERVKLDLESKLMNLQSTQTTAMNDEIETSRSELEACHHKLSSLEREITYKTNALEKSKKQSDATKLSLELRIRELSESESRLRSTLLRSEVTVSELNDCLRNLEVDTQHPISTNTTSSNIHSNNNHRIRSSYDSDITSTSSETLHHEQGNNNRDSTNNNNNNSLSNSNHPLSSIEIISNKSNNNNNSNSLLKSLELEQSRNAKLTAELNVTQSKVQSLTEELQGLQTESKSQLLSDRNEINRLQVINKKLIDQFSFSENNTYPTTGNTTNTNMYDINNMSATTTLTTTNGYVSIGNNIKNIGELYVLRGRQKSLQLEILLLKKENSELKENISNAVMHRDREEKRVSTPECFKTPRTANKSMSKLSILTPVYEGNDHDVGPWTMTTTSMTMGSPFDARSTSAFGSPTPSTMTPIGSQIRRLQNKLEEQNDDLQLQQEQINSLQSENTLLKDTKSNLEKTLATQLNNFSLRISTEITKISKLYGSLFVTKRDKEMYRSDMNRLNRIIFELKEEINNYKTKLMHLEDENQQLVSNTDSKMLISELQSKIISLEQQLKGINEIQWDLETKVITSDNTITSLRSSENALRLKLGESQQTILFLETRLKEMEQVEGKRHLDEIQEKDREIEALVHETGVLRSQIMDLESSTALLTRRVEMIMENKKKLEEGFASTENEYRIKMESWSLLEATLETEKCRLQSDLHISQLSEKSLRENLLALENEMTELRRQHHVSTSNDNNRYQRELKALRQSYDTVCNELRKSRLEQSSLISYLEGSAKSLKRRVDDWERGLDASYPETVRLRAELTSWEQDFDLNKSIYSNMSQMSDTESVIAAAAVVGDGRHGGNSADDSHIKSLMNALLNMKEELCRVLTQRTILESDNYKLQSELKILKQDSRQRGKEMMYEEELECKSSEIALLKESEEILKSKLLSGDLERNELISKINYLQNKLVTTSERLTTVERQYNQSITVMKQEREVHESKKESELRIEKLKIKLASAELAVSKGREDVTTIQGRLSALSQKLAESQTRRRQLESENEELSSARTQLAEELKLKASSERMLQFELEAAKEKQRTSEESLSDMRIDRRVFEDRLEAMNKENEELADKIQSLVNERKESWSKIQSYSEEVSLLRQRVNSMGLGLDNQYNNSKNQDVTINVLQSQIHSLEEEKSLLIFTIDELRAALQSNNYSTLRKSKGAPTSPYFTAYEKFNIRDIMLSNEDNFTKLQRAYERIIYLEEERERILSRFNRLSMTRQSTSMDLNSSDELLLIQDSRELSTIPGQSTGIKSMITTSDASSPSSRYHEKRASHKRFDTSYYDTQNKEKNEDEVKVEEAFHAPHDTRRRSGSSSNFKDTLQHNQLISSQSYLQGPKKSPLSPERDREQHAYSSSQFTNHPPVNTIYNQQNSSKSRGSGGSSQQRYEKDKKPPSHSSVTSSLDSFVLYTNPTSATTTSNLTLKSSSKSLKRSHQSRQNKSDDQHALIDAIKRKDELLRRKEAELNYREKEMRTSSESILRTKLAAEEKFRNATEIAAETELRTNRLVNCVDAMREVHNKLSEEANKNNN